MKTEVDEFIKELDRLIETELREAYGDAAYERWLNPRHAGSIDHPDGFARLSGSCDDYVEISLRFKEDRVVEAKFRTNGCGSSTVCGSLAAELALGKRSDELSAVAGEAILESLGGLPQAEVHCAYLAGNALQAALKDYLAKRTKA